MQYFKVLEKVFRRKQYKIIEAEITNSIGL